MLKNFFKLFLFLSVSFASIEGFGGHSDLESLYEKVLKQNYEKIAPLREYAQKRQTVYIVSAILALLVFAFFIKYFKLTGALVALVMIAGGIYYLKTQTPAISPYKEKFADFILSPIGNFCCGYRYNGGKISLKEISESKIFAQRIKDFRADDGLFMKEGVHFGYVDITFDTKENASVERFAENVFSGFVIVLDQPHSQEGGLVSDLLKQKVASMDPEFNAFFANMPRKGKSNGFELYGDISQETLDKCYPLSSEMVAVAFTRGKTYIFYYQKRNPLDPGVYQKLDLQSVRAYASVFQSIDKLVKYCK